MSGDHWDTNILENPSRCIDETQIVGCNTHGVVLDGIHEETQIVELTNSHRLMTAEAVDSIAETQIAGCNTHRLVLERDVSGSK